MAVAVILAGGIGARFGSDKPKQFTALAGRPIMDYAVDRFSSHPDIEELIVTYPDSYDDEVEAIAAKYRSRKPITLVRGGATRTESTLNALGAMSGKRQKVLFHDAVRPFCSSQIISNTIAALDTADAADVVIDTADTIVQVDEPGSYLASIPNRAKLRRGQTPQGFWTDSLANAYAHFDREALKKFTDDCGVLLAYQPTAKIAAVEGSDTNIKITRSIDMFLAEQLLYLGEFGGGALVQEAVTDPVAVVIGDTSGLGLVVKENLIANGWRVFGASRSVGVDVRNPAALSAFMQNVVQQAGKIDMVANFAGVLHVGDLQNTELDKIDETLSINLMGSINVARASHPHLKVTQGQLILCSSSSYFRGRGQTAVYSASKAAVVNLTQALAEEWHPEGISVSCIVPRRADTPMRRKAFPDEDPSVCMAPDKVAEAMEELLGRRQTGLIRHVY